MTRILPHTGPPFFFWEKIDKREPVWREARVPRRTKFLGFFSFLHSLKHFLCTSSLYKIKSFLYLFKMKPIVGIVMTEGTTNPNKLVRFLKRPLSRCRWFNLVSTKIVKIKRRLICLSVCPSLSRSVSLCILVTAAAHTNTQNVSRFQFCIFAKSNFRKKK